MKRTQLACLLAAGVAFSPLAFAGPNTLGPLATITGEGCNYGQHPELGTSLFAHWSWADGTIQTQFGGDAEFHVTGTTTGDVPFDVEVEFELVKYVPGTPADAYPGAMVYRCSVPESSTAGECNGAVLGVRNAIREATAAELGVDPAEITSIVATLDGVEVKAMNPGKGNGRQNYPLVDVCALPPI